MKITLINTSEYSGGAAIACKRLFNALRNKGIDVNFIVQENKSINDRIININSPKLSNYKNLLYLAIEKFHFWFYEKNKQIRFNFSTALTGKRFSNLPLIKQSNIIHLHWFNQGMMSLSGFKKIASNKNIIWTLHDMWAFTGGCHYNADCNNFKNECGNCKFLKSQKANDLSHKQFLKKQQIYNNCNITFVTCSEWLAGEAKKSKLLKNCKVINIPNPINTNDFKPISKYESRRKFSIDETKYVILFGAASLKDKRKGLKYFIESLNILKSKNEINESEIIIAYFGKANDELVNMTPFKTVNLGYLSEFNDLAKMYSASDVYVTTALQDNLPNTVMESLSCGTPVVAFEIGGIPQMVENKYNGYLAKSESSQEIAEGIKWLYFADRQKISDNSRNKVLYNFSEEIISQKYIELYSTFD